MTDREAVAGAMGNMIRRLSERLPDVARRTQQTLVSEIPELRDDTQLATLLTDTVAANIETVFGAMKNDIPMDQVAPPAVALEYARRLAQREVPASVMVRAYRIGHQSVLNVMLKDLSELDLNTATAIDTVGKITSVSFDYIDSISQKVITTYHEERQRWQDSRSHERAAWVRDLLRGETFDVDEMSQRIRYPLRQTHLAVVVWWPESGGELAGLERFIRRITRSITGGDLCLFVPADRLTAWAWIPMSSESGISGPDFDALIAGIDGAPYVATGRILTGPEGFRRSHQQAIEAQHVATSRSDPVRTVRAWEPGVLLAGLLSEQIENTRLWIEDVLGPLAGPSDNDARLRETLRSFLGAGSSYKAAASDLHLHFNTVRYRVDRAIHRRGTPIGDDRVDVEVALTLCHLLGPSILAG